MTGIVLSMNDPFLHSILEEWVEQGRQEGRQEGIEEERARAQEREAEAMRQAREGVLALIQGRFPALVPQAKKQVSKIKQLATLQNLLVKIGLAANQEEAEHFLLDWQQIDAVA